jgi:2-aminoadipate transaminase
MSAQAGNWEEALLRESLSRRARALGSSAWGAPVAATSAVAPIELTGGIPDPESLPTGELIDCSRVVLERDGKNALRYGGLQGYLGLREWLAAWLSSREGVAVEPGWFMLGNGSAGALATVCETFLDPGDTVVVEGPTFPGALRTIRSCLADIVAVPVDREGLLPELLAETLDRLLREGRRAKMLYTIPNFQNPSGVTLSSERRQAVVEMARDRRLLVVEDDAYGELAFSREPPPSLFSLAEGRGVLKLGTFSKTIATGLRVGWVLAQPEYVGALLGMRFEVGGSPWVQRTVAEYSRAGALEKQIPLLRDLYRRKCDLMLRALERHCSAYARWSAPEGGFFVWLELLEGIDASVLGETALREGVTYVPGAAFFPSQPGLTAAEAGRRHVRLAFSFVKEDQIEEAVRRLAAAMKDARR